MVIQSPKSENAKKDRSAKGIPKADENIQRFNENDFEVHETQIDANVQADFSNQKSEIFSQFTESVSVAVDLKDKSGQISEQDALEAIRKAFQFKNCGGRVLVVYTGHGRCNGGDLSCQNNLYISLEQVLAQVPKGGEICIYLDSCYSQQWCDTAAQMASENKMPQNVEYLEIYAFASGENIVDWGETRKLFTSTQHKGLTFEKQGKAF